MNRYVFGKVRWVLSLFATCVLVSIPWSVAQSQAPVRFVQDSTAGIPIAPAADHRFTFPDKDPPLPQTKLDMSPKMGKTESSRYLPEVDVDEPRTVIDYRSVPASHAGDVQGLAGGQFAWVAPDFYHRPLYFEQKNLERYGHFYKNHKVQSALSVAHFFATVPTLPLKMLHDHPCERKYALGHYRPGNCNPNFKYRCVPK